MLVGFDNGRARSYWVVSDDFAQGRSGSVDGVSTGNVYNFDHWQYVDEMYYYDHDLFSVPPTQWINAAHRNGVPVLGTVTGDCGDPCGDGKQAQMLLDAAHYQQAVQKMYDYAVAYGFDGWIIDFENNFAPNDDTLKAVKELAAMRLPDGRAMRIVVYQAYNYDLVGGFPKADLTPYLEAGASWQSDYSNPAGKYPEQAYAHLKEGSLENKHLSAAHWATDVYKRPFGDQCADLDGERTTTTQIWNGNGTECLDTKRVFLNQQAIVPSSSGPDTPSYYTSLGLYAPEWTYFGSLPDPAPGHVAIGPKDREAVHAADDAFWVGDDVSYSGSDCARAGTSNAVSSLISPRSVIGSLPFVTNFNEGEGSVYAIEGRVVSAEPWNDLSAQDVPPTWSCQLSGNVDATPVYAASADGDAFNGGSGLRLTGEAPGEEGLYEAHVDVPAESNPTVAVTAKTISGPLPYVRLRFSDGTSATVQSTASGPGWQKTTAPVDAQGKTIVGISVGFPSSNAPIDTVLGQLRLYDANSDVTPSSIDVTSAGPTISWTQPPQPAIAYWNVYSSSGDCLSFLGPAFTSSYDVSQPMFVSPGQDSTDFVVQPVSSSGAAAKVGRLCGDGS